MQNSDRIELIKQQLTATLAPTQLDVMDDSHKHIGHAGAQSGAGHFTLVIATEKFKEKSLVECHRLIYQALGEMMGKDIHALQIKIVR